MQREQAGGEIEARVGERQQFLVRDDIAARRACPLGAPDHGRRQVGMDHRADRADPVQRRCELTAAAAQVEGEREAPPHVAHPLGQAFGDVAHQHVVPRQPGGGAVAMGAHGGAIEDEARSRQVVGHRRYMTRLPGAAKGGHRKGD